jgi:hypothetical protein
LTIKPRCALLRYESEPGAIVNQKLTKQYIKAQMATADRYAAIKITALSKPKLLGVSGDCGSACLPNSTVVATARFITTVRGRLSEYSRDDDKLRRMISKRDQLTQVLDYITWVMFYFAADAAVVRGCKDGPPPWLHRRKRSSDWKMYALVD